jgi:O-acetyl-ADP-ribose deacetylase (regulator of RNase III)/uncharacterized protein YwgA
MDNVRVIEGDLLKSRMQTLVNTVNTVGIMGKGIALAFKKKYPEMYKDYVRRCDAKMVRLGEPYPYTAADHIIVNFPTKEHWRSVSRLQDIVTGLEHLENNYKRWDIQSIAVPPLGCGNGQLEWRVVGPVLLRHLRRLDIPVELYAPYGTPLVDRQLDLLGSADDSPQGDERLEPWLVALAEIIRRLEDQPYHWPVGRVILQKTAYFATVAGLPTELTYEAASFGPFAPGLKPAIARMQNNGIIEEHHRGRMFEVVTGRFFDDARSSYADSIAEWEEIVNRTVDLMIRFDATRAEAAATAHFTASKLATELGRAPTISEVVAAVEAWKIRRRPEFKRDDILRAIVHLGTRGWLQVQPDEDSAAAVEDFVTTGTLTG